MEEQGAVAISRLVDWVWVISFCGLRGDENACRDEPIGRFC